MNLSPPSLPAPTRRDDLAMIIRDATLSAPHKAMNEESLLSATRDFISHLEKNKIPHVLVGGLAVLQYIEGRNTRDIDIIFSVEDLERLPDLILTEKNDWFASGEVGPLRVDFLFTDNPFFARIAEQHSMVRDFMHVRLNCATPEGIILLKLFALPSLYRQGQIDRAALYETDILMLLRHTPIDDDILKKQLISYMSATDIVALLEVLSDIRNRMDKGSRF